MNCIILGDKFQKRMKSKGCVGLFDLNNKSIIQHQYRNIKQNFPYANIIYVHGFESKKLCSFVEKNSTLANNMTMVHNAKYERYNQGYSLSLAQEYLNDGFLLLLGENIFNYHHMHNYINYNSHDSYVLLDKKHKGSLGCTITNQKIEHIAYDLDNSLCEIYYISKTHASYIKKLINNSAYYNYFIFELINKLLDNHQIIKPLFINQKQLST